MRVLRFITLILLVFFFSAGVKARSQDAGYEIVTGELPPYSYSIDGQIFGVATDVIRELIHRVGSGHDIILEPWKRAIFKSEQERLTYPLARTVERENRYKWIGPILKDQFVFTVRAALMGNFDTIDEFRNLKVGVNRGAPTEDRLKELGFHKVEPVVEEKLNLRKLLAGHIDAWYTSLLILKGSLKQSGISNTSIKIVYADLNIEQYVGGSLDIDDQVIGVWQEKLIEMKADGSYQLIMRKHGIDAEFTHQ